ncbi:MAG: alpha/beta fold hydrolase [Gammaproteobacteria bacterium]
MRNATIMQTSPVPPAEEFIELDGARLRYRDEGKGFPLILIHGWALDLDMWQPQVPAWFPRLRVIRFDRRGFGGSVGQPSLLADARDVESLLRRLNLPRAALLGMSQGARVAMRVAAGPQRKQVVCVILDGAPFDVGDAGEPEIPLARYRALVREQGMDAFRKEWSGHPFVQLHSNDRVASELLQVMTCRYPGTDLLAPAGTSDGELPAAGTIAVPTLVLNGALDTPRRRSMGDELCRALPNAERVLVPSAGHLSNLDNPTDYSRLVLAFIERHITVS